MEVEGGVNFSEYFCQEIEFEDMLVSTLKLTADMVGGGFLASSTDESYYAS